MKIFMIKLQIILIALIGGGGYTIYTKKQQDPALDVSVIDPLARGVDVQSDDTFDILKTNLDNADHKDPGQIAEELMREAYRKNPDAKASSEMVRRAQEEAVHMMQSGDVDPYRHKIENDPLLQRVMGR